MNTNVLQSLKSAVFDHKLDEVVLHPIVLELERSENINIQRPNEGDATDEVTHKGKRQGA